MPTIVPFCAILQLPSLLVRAQGPCNCSGLGRHRICPSLRYRLHALGTYGLRSGDGRLLEAVARSRILANLRYTRDLASTNSGILWREGPSARRGVYPERSRGGPWSGRRDDLIKGHHALASPP